MVFDPDLEQRMMRSLEESEAKDLKTLTLNGVTFESDLPMNIPENPFVGSLLEGQVVKVRALADQSRQYTLAFFPEGNNMEDAVFTKTLVAETTFSFEAPGIFSVTWS